MKITVSNEYELQLEEVFIPIRLLTEKGEEMCICMRDSGFEFSYEGQSYSAKEGVIEKFEIPI